jgi:hypothetical protein
MMVFQVVTDEEMMTGVEVVAVEAMVVVMVGEMVDEMVDVMVVEVVVVDSEEERRIIPTLG